MHRRLCAASFLLIACPSEEPTTETSGNTHADSHDDHGSGSSESSSSTTDASSSESTAIASEGSSESSSSSSSTAGSTSAAIDTWENWALPSFFAVYCNECHPAAGQSMRDFSDYDTVGENFEHIRCGVAPQAIEGCDGHIEPGHLPIGDGPFPTDDERLRLVDWLDAGMPRD